MREYLFHGKEVDSGEWSEGSLWIHLGKTYIMTAANVVGYEVDPETVGQYTGLTDKNGVKIFEGDIIQIPDDYDEYGHNAGEIYEIYFCCGGFRLKPKYSEERGYWLADDRTVEVIGNIHDNPELLKEGGEE